MRLTRRKFFGILVAAAVGGSGAMYAGRRRAAAWYRRLVDPSVGNEPTGPLKPETLKALLAATETLIDYPLDLGHYAGLFSWRAENLPGHRALYEQFAATVNDAASQTRGCDFALCEPAVRQKILAPAFQVRAARGRLDRMRMNARSREWVLFDLHIVRPVTLLFARTDAWRMAGYDAWPGTPRGLEEYVRAPSGAGSRPLSHRLRRGVG
jgi:hypothetical protein